MIMKMIMIMYTLYSKLWQFHQRYTSDDIITVAVAGLNKNFEEQWCFIAVAD